tara:strand:+ start:398 stop:601 length:204 start_codon:yes stop_codon:yes gene_type:complete
MSESLEYYDFFDLQLPGKAYEDFDKKVKKIFKQENEPNVKPEHIFEGYNKKKTPKLRRSTRAKPKKK